MADFPNNAGYANLMDTQFFYTGPAPYIPGPQQIIVVATEVVLPNIKRLCKDQVCCPNSMLAGKMIYDTRNFVD